MWSRIIDTLANAKALTKWLLAFQFLFLVCGSFAGMLIALDIPPNEVSFWASAKNFLDPGTRWYAFILPILALVVSECRSYLERRRELLSSRRDRQDVMRVCTNIITQHLEVMLKKIPRRNNIPITDLKISLYVPDGQKLKFLTRAGGHHESVCNHEFNIEGDDQGVVGMAYSRFEMIIIDNLPDLHESTLTSRDRRSRMELYADSTGTTRGYVQEEYDHKVRKKRTMPRTLIGQGVTEPGNPNRMLGSVVVDCTLPTLELPFDIFSSLVEALSVPLRKVTDETR